MPMISSIEFLSTGFQAGVPLRFLLDKTIECFGASAWSTEAAQKALVLRCFGDNENKLNFGRQREKRFLRLLFDEIDREGYSEIAEELIDAAVTRCSRTDPMTQQFAYIRFNDCLLRCSSVMSDVGMRLWEAGVALTDALSSPGNALQTCCRGKRVLEIGAGVGLSAKGYERAGVSHAILSEPPGDALENLRNNVAMNDCQQVTVAGLDITDADALLEVRDEWNVDTVIAADVCYDPELIHFLVKSFAVIIGSTDSIGILVINQRSEDRIVELNSVGSQKKKKHISL